MQHELAERSLMLHLRTSGTLTHASLFPEANSLLIPAFCVGETLRPFPKVISRLPYILTPICLACAQEGELEPLQVLRGKSPAVGAGWSRAYDREDLDASRGLHLDSLLRSYPGFSTFRRSGSGIAHPTSQGVSLRGMGASGASRSLVFLDGIPMN